MSTIESFPIAEEKILSPPKEKPLKLVFGLGFL
jgi:hypothetical protein